MLPKNSSAGPLQRIHCNAAARRVSFSAWALWGATAGSIWFHFIFFLLVGRKPKTPALHHAAVQTCLSWCNCWNSIFLCPLLKYTGRKIHLSIGLLKYNLFFQMGFNLICKNTVFLMFWEVNRLLNHTAGLSVTQWVLCVQGTGCLSSLIFMWYNICNVQHCCSLKALESGHLKPYTRSHACYPRT